MSVDIKFIIIISSASIHCKIGFQTGKDFYEEKGGKKKARSFRKGKVKVSMLERKKGKQNFSDQWQVPTDAG